MPSFWQDISTWIDSLFGGEDKTPTPKPIIANTPKSAPTPAPAVVPTPSAPSNPSETIPTPPIPPSAPVAPAPEPVVAPIAPIPPPAPASPPMSAAAPLPGRHALAYYYTWFSKPVTTKQGLFGSHWAKVDMTAKTCSGTPEYPLNGPYDSGDPATVNAQFAAMAALGLTGVVVSWWGAQTITDQHMPTILAAAKANNMMAAIAFETLKTGTAPQDNLQYVLQTYGADPNYLKVDGLPVVFINSVAYHAAGGYNVWLAARSAVSLKCKVALDFNDTKQQQFEVKNGFADIAYNYGTHAEFGQMTADQIQSAAPGIQKALVAACAPSMSVAVAFPNQNGTLVHTLAGGALDPKIQAMFVDNHGGSTMQATLAAAIAANPDWLLVVSWNEWGEGSQWEPSVQYPNPDPTGQLTSMIKEFLASPKT